MSYFDLECARCQNPFWHHLPEAGMNPTYPVLTFEPAYSTTTSSGVARQILHPVVEYRDCDEFSFCHQGLLLDVD